MSFGDPNNPYAQQGQQPGQQPGYGQPQGAQPGQGYPQAPPVQNYGAPGYAAAGPTEMPGITKAARIFLFVIVACQVVVAALYGYYISEFDANATGLDGTEAEIAADIGKGLLGFLLGLSLVFAALGLVLALKWNSGGNTVRVCAIVYGAFAIISGLFTIPVGLITLIVAILLIVFAAKGDTAEWFRRPRH
ncbi:hypothetical protein NPS70_19120 [Streptomyces sp. C10-9-1]|uniref:hypothetical protein n=1 Tax=Streptomyces sp. C10-9-1 TaxID=1859285 RepID=UPI0021122BF2|nr:hypothetical protein [Streptomyces sp. C10-9-1]MCQ6555288.1 hypothetical protein [Streptomyces sp. C10-9-1]